jgi:hypothetical protein
MGLEESVRAQDESDEQDGDEDFLHGLGSIALRLAKL